MKKLIKGIAVAVTLAVVSACAANTMTSQNNDDNSFGIQGNASADKQFGGMGFGMKGFMKDLNLTDAQKAQFKALKNDAKTHFSSQKDNRKAFMTAIKDSFLSATMDKAALKAKLESLKPNEDENLTYMANSIVKAYNILNADQKSKIESKLNDMQSKASQFMNKAKSGNFSKMKEKRFDWFTKDLNLTDAQKTSLKALADDAMPDRTAMFDKMKTAKDSVLKELKSGNPNIDNIKAALKSAKPDFEANIDSKLDKLIQAHDILNAEQRQKLVDRLGKMHQGFGKRMHHKKA